MVFNGWLKNIGNLIFSKVMFFKLFLILLNDNVLFCENWKKKLYGNIM